MDESRLSEFALLAKILHRQESPDLILPNGDDAAVIKIGRSLVAITTDAVVENKHFSFSYFSGRQVGIKSVESAVSDLIAVGAVPKGIVIALSISELTETVLIEEVYKGIYAASERLGCQVLGGDLTVNSGGLEVAVTALGHIEKKRDIITRSGAKAGDLVCVTGALGASMAGFRAIRAGLAGFKATRLKHLQPLCRFDLCGKLKGVHAAIDISDGLSSEINHICQASHCGAMITASDIPIAPEVRQIAATLNENPLDYALNGGEDYELLLAVAPKRYNDLMGSVIGVFTESPEILIEIDNQQRTLQPRGYDHLVKS